MTDVQGTSILCGELCKGVSQEVQGWMAPPRSTVGAIGCGSDRLGCTKAAAIAGESILGSSQDKAEVLR